jgi:predicted glycosyltransferase
VADYFGISGDKIITKKGKAGRTYSVRGTTGAGSIKLPTAKKVKGVTRYKAIPVPAQATIAQIKTFLTKAIKKAKPDHFISVDGQSWPL